MVKKVCLLFISCLVTILMSPSILTATDHVVIKGVSDAKVVETVPLPEPEPESEVVEPVIAVKSPSAGIPAVSVAPATPVIPNYTVTNYIGSRQEYMDTAMSLSYSSIYKYNKMVYGHNTYNLLGSLANRSVGETITITEGGAVNTYRVAAVSLYEKTADGNLNGDPQLMASIANTAFGHSLALFTCAGTSYGNGDASHRLVVFVDQI